MQTGISILALYTASAIAYQTTPRALGPNRGTATATILAGSITGGLAGSVVSANPCATTYAFACTDDDTCDGRTWTYSLTKGLSTYEVQYSSSAQGTKGTAHEVCQMHGSYYAVCTETIRLSYDGTKTAMVTTMTASGTELTYGQFPITAGVEKVAQVTGVCTASGNAAVGRETVEVLKVLMLPVAAAVAARMVV
ncbi:hypothetical protein B0A55_07529 [Friedmanniomyces simplex]|uniref:Uncharacterized protein n=1 Tax=Friedmanniomyces simplex TaxID=329884 RepID=A0A4U0X2L1_9PEZI|nr:hypothetical protein B0A55_07529 [Friedmanniomyces simplex]